MSTTALRWMRIPAFLLVVITLLMLVLTGNLWWGVAVVASSGATAALLHKTQASQKADQLEEALIRAENKISDLTSELGYYKNKRVEAKNSGQRRNHYSELLPARPASGGYKPTPDFYDYYTSV